MIMFYITENDIARLDETSFADVMNHLLIADAVRHGLPAHHIHVSLKTKEGDGGVDARVEVPGVQGSQFLPYGMCVVQYKAGDTNVAELKKEVAKPGVIAALQQQGYYLVAIGHPYGAKARATREKGLREGAEEGLGYKPLDAQVRLLMDAQVRLLTASDIATWASQYPAVLRLEYFARPYGELLPYNKWERQAAHRIPYVASPAHTALLTDLREQLQAQDGQHHMVLAGDTGSGRTRFAIELFRDLDQSALLLYAPSADVVPDGMFAWLAANSTTSLYLVVDGCDGQDVNKLDQLAESCGNRVRLITIATNPRALSLASLQVVDIPLLPEESQRLMAQHAGSALPEPMRLYLARLSSGYPKLIVELCRAAAQNPDLALSSLSLRQDTTVRAALRFLAPDDKDRQVLRSMALLTRVGVKDEVADEGKALASFIGMSVDEWSVVVHRLEERGLLTAQGRYRQVSPNLLAVSLAAEVWEDRRTDITSSLLPSLPPAAKYALLERIRDLGAHPDTEEIALQIVKNFLQDQSSLASHELSRLLASALQALNPLRALEELEAALSILSRDQLLLITGSARRVFVEELQRLAWFREAFTRAAGLLLRLADAETESWVNNATGVFAGLFRVHLGGTSTPALARLPALEGVLRSTEPNRRLLAVAGLGQMLSPFEVRDRGSEDQGGRVPPAEWQPDSLEGERVIRIAALKLLDIALADAVANVAHAARSVLLGATRFFVRLGLSVELLPRLRQLPRASDEDRSHVVRGVEHILLFEQEALVASERTELQEFLAELNGRSFSDRLHRWVGRWPSAEYMPDGPALIGELPAIRNIDELADEMVLDPRALPPEDWQWLISQRAENAELLGKALGERDPERRWLPAIVEHLTPQANPLLFAGYLWADVDTTAPDCHDDVIDQLGVDRPELAALLTQVTWSGPVRERGGARVVDYAEQGLINAAQMTLFAWRKWPQELSLETFQRLLRAVVKPRIKDIEAPLTLLKQRLDTHLEEAGVLSALAWELLSQIDEAQYSIMALVYWQKIAEVYAGENPLRMAQLIFQLLESLEDALSVSGHLIVPLSKATQIAPDLIWPIAAAALSRKDSVGYRTRLMLRGTYVTLFPEETVLAWAAAHQPHGPALIASLVAFEAAPSTLGSLPRALLERFSDDQLLKDELHSRFITGSIQGPYSRWIEQKSSVLAAWQANSSPQVEAWAVEVRSALLKQLRAVSRIEDEELGGYPVIRKLNIIESTNDSESPAPDAVDLFALASEQMGYFLTGQARTLGYSLPLLSHNVKTGRFHRVRRGLYRLRDYPSSPNEEVMAAWLSAGKERSVVSHESALALLGLSDVVPNAIHILVPRSRRGLQFDSPVSLHTTTHPLQPGDVVVREGIRLTAPLRTILDVAETGTASEQVIMAVAQARRRGWLTADELRAGAHARGARAVELVEQGLGAA